MKLFPALLSLFIVAKPTDSPVVVLQVLQKESVIVWTGTKVWGKHQGVVKISEGRIQMQDGKLRGGDFIIDMRSIECTDIPDHEPVPKKRLENHLKDPDFFDVIKFPTAKFVITNVRPDPANASKYQVSGDLTIKHTTRPIEISIEPSEQTENSFMGRADIRFNRQHWGVAFKGVGDEMVHDQVTLNVFIKAG